MYDYHTHSSFSDDATVPIDEMIQAAIDKNIKEYAITDHFDPEYPDHSIPFNIDFPSYHKELDRVAEQYASKIKIIKGVEIGIQKNPIAKICSDCANAYNYDFIIGSFHTACGDALDMSSYHRNRDNIKATVDYYEYAYEALKEFNDFDVLGHINVIDRYVDEIPSSSYYMDQVEAILKHLVENGKGMEINTSSFRYGLGERTTPPQSILQLYVDLGGEIITTGSDAHRPEDVGYRLDFAEEMIRKTGHKYVATFHDRQLIQHKL